MNRVHVDHRRSSRAGFRFLPAVLLLTACEVTTDTTGAQRLSGEYGMSQGAAEATMFAPGVISQGHTEQWRLTFTPDGRTAYFATSAGFFPITRQSTIYVSHYSRGAWSTPEVAPFSGVYGDIDPFISPDGQRLYFSSIRPEDGVMRGDIDIFYVERTPQGWSEPTRLGSEVNSAEDELYASVSGDGTLYFASGPIFPQAGKHFDIYRAERDGDGFSSREALGPAINTTPGPLHPGLQDAWDFNPEISIDGRTLLFTSLRPGGYGFGDIYVSNLVNGEWTPARNLGPLVNTASDEAHPTLSRNRQELFFIRRIPYRSNFYTISTSQLDLR